MDFILHPPPLNIITQHSLWEMILHCCWIFFRNHKMCYLILGVLVRQVMSVVLDSWELTLVLVSLLVILRYCVQESRLADKLLRNLIMFYQKLHWWDGIDPNITGFIVPWAHKTVDDEVDGAVEHQEEVVDVGHGMHPLGVVGAQTQGVAVQSLGSNMDLEIRLLGCINSRLELTL